jgi:hypothetical protein
MEAGGKFLKSALIEGIETAVSASPFDVQFRPQ